MPRRAENDGVDVRKSAAAVSTAGLLLVAGCAGGSLKAGSYSPPAPKSTQAAIPADSPTVSLSLTIPNATAEDRTATSTSRRQKYIGSGVFGGSVVVKIFQGASPAFPDQTFSVGGYGSAFTCSSPPPTYALQCSASIHAPPGNDTFYVETFDSSNRLLSVTPGLYGFYGTPPSPYNITSSGGSVTVPTYAVVSRIQVLAGTRCVRSSGTQFSFMDADGNAIGSSPLANPVQLQAGGGTMYKSGVAQSSPYTIYDATGLYLWSLSPSQLGSAMSFNGVDTVSSGTLPSNINSLVAVDHLAFSATAGGGLSATGLWAGTSPGTVSCGTVPTALYNSGGNSPPAITFTNPVAIGGSDSPQAVVVVDNGGANPVVSVVALNGLHTSPGLFVPVSQVTLPNAGGSALEVAVSQAKGKIYVLLSDGTVQTVDYSKVNSNPFLYAASFYGTAASGLSTPSGSGIDVYTGGANDALFVASAGGPRLYEIDNASTGTPGAPIAISVSGIQGETMGGGGIFFNLSPATTGSSVLVDNFSGNVMFRLYDPNAPSGYNGNSLILPCSATGPCSSTLGTAMGAGATPTGPQTIALSGSHASGSELRVIFGNAIQFWGENPAMSGGVIFSGLNPLPTRIVSSRDALWFGAQQGSSFSAFTGSFATAGAGGANGTIVNGGFF